MRTLAEAPLDEPPASGEATRHAAGALLRLAIAGGAAQAGPRLLILDPEGGARTVPLATGLTLGRAADAGLRLDDPAASRRHARLEVDGEGRVTVRDLGSKNGLLLGAQRVTGVAPLQPGEELRVGRTLLRLDDPAAGPRPPGGPQPSTALAPGAWPSPAGPWRALGAAALALTAAALLAASW